MGEEGAVDEGVGGAEGGEEVVGVDGEVERVSADGADKVEVGERADALAEEHEHRQLRAAAPPAPRTGRSSARTRPPCSRAPGGVGAVASPILRLIKMCFLFLLLLFL